MSVSSSQDKNTDEQDADSILQESRLRVSSWGVLYTFPWWGLALVLLGIWVVFSIAADEIYQRIFEQLQAGIAMTIRGTAA